ncbi:mandelate racemase/muconate lactonizing enzyme family protein [Paraliomyxa miuraensis]|uniref:mandelate racemase/muconate lactonizing enzyme family protein n=1 Tax=Paraliomyxa miuraensis TaxID=376150 RepID=UPI00225B87FD|nr:enolase C-terminal domain-like protein [Paraliomyxa miuraensis]MCX4240777.1 hypothetical protein [Paraliomyxa miuraensis]
MRIDAAVLHRVQIPFAGKQRFGHASSERSCSDAVFVELRDDQGGVGWGEILPRAYVTGETLEGVLERTGPQQARRLLGVELSDRSMVEAWIRQTLPTVGRDLATFGGFELALLDLAGRRMGFSLADVLGGQTGNQTGNPTGNQFGPSLPAGVIIGFEIATRKLKTYCALLRNKGHRHIKVKVGLPDDDERLQVITRVFGPDVPLRLDANEAWAKAPPEVAAAEILTLARIGIPIHSVEQPLGAGDLAGMRWLREHAGAPIMADESVCSLADAEAIVRARAADIFNVRVGKHGGVLASLAIVEHARAAGIGVHLGTMVGESGVLSRVAEVFGRCVPGFACLDGKGQNRFLLEEDVLAGPTDAAKDPAAVTPLTAPGLGVDVDPEIIARRARGRALHLPSPSNSRETSSRASPAAEERPWTSKRN